MTNDLGAGRLAGAVGRTVLKHLTTDVRPAPAPVVPVADLDRYVGHYRLASPTIEFLRFKTDVYGGVTIRRHGQHLVVRGGRWAARLIPTGVDRFRFPRDIDTSIVFGRTPPGRQVVVIGDTYFEQESGAWAAARKWALEISIFLLLATAVAPIVFVSCPDPRQRALVVRPFAAALCLLGMSYSFDHAHDAGILGERGVATVAVWLLSWGFAAWAHGGFARALRSFRSDVSPALRAYALVTSAAAVWIALHLSRYGLIGLRTWLW